MRKSFLKYIALFFTFIGFLFLNIFTQTVGAFKYIEPTSNASDIKKIQSLFSELNIYKGEDTGKYSDIKDTIIDFQMENKIISSKTQDSAGYIGPKTYSVLEKNYGDDFTTTYNKIFKVKIINSGLEGTETYFVVSAYYSPLPGQKRYATGSYARDIKLNGNGTHGASGVAVHPGFIAAPSTYSFGTKIEIEGLGVGTVEDRGGAIVRAGVRGHEYDRLDIWMGYGDEGLTRALNWGKKTVKGKIMPRESENTIEYSGTKVVTSNSLAIKITP
ncbi:3D domain-containing protein, partial [Candidatus Gracilibacteria bacterium]|nr:3D domain-containing protein [Candidatus Gracilibacteria bacterium]